MVPALSGALAGALLGYVLQRSGLCLHAAAAGLYRRTTGLAQGWLLGIAIASVGLSLVYLTPLGVDLNHGLPFRPVANVLGGLLLGAGMAVARSCISGLFYKLGAGMLGAVVGLVAWGAGEVLARQVPRPGPTVLAGGESATLPGLLGAPRLLVAVVFLLAVVLLVLRRPEARDTGLLRPPWSRVQVGAGIGAATTAGWLLAGLGGADFGPSSVGAVSGLVRGTPDVWLLAFLTGIVVGAFLTARLTGELRLRGESPVRYRQLALGGLLLGAGGWIAGGCTVGHGISGAAQLGVSSWVVIAALLAGLGLTRSVQRRTGRLTELTSR